MAAPLPLRLDFTADDLRLEARRTRDADQARRLLALAAIYDGGSRGDAARIGGVGLQIVRDWVVRFNAEGPGGLIDRKAPGASSKLNDDHRRALVARVEEGPVPAVHGVVRWRLCDLALGRISHCHQHADAQPRAATARLSQAFGPPAPSWPGSRGAGDVQKNFPTAVATIATAVGPDKRIEVWFQDEARVGQKNGITRRWARRGTRPSAPQDQRTASAYIFGAICPREGKGAALVLPRCTTEAMTLHLEEISRAVAPDAHAVVVLDQAGWHGARHLRLPDNITLLPLPPRSPQLNPVENVWQFMRDNWLSNRVFHSYQDVLDHCCAAWNRLVAQPWTIMSIGLRTWAHEF